MKAKLLLADFGQTVELLDQALRLPPSNDVIRAGAIQYFEFSFELAWKAVQGAARALGLGDCASPKACLRLAFRQGWIADEEVWLEMLEARNRMAHTYDAQRALEIYSSLPRFQEALRGLHTALSQDR